MNLGTLSKGQWWLTAALLLVVVVMLDSRDMLPSSRRVQALENPVEDRQQMIAQLQRANEKLDRLINILESGKVKVVVANAEELKGAQAAPASAQQPGEKADGGEPKVIIKRKGE